MCYNTNHSNSIGKEKKGKCDMITQNLKYVHECVAVAVTNSIRKNNTHKYKN